DSEKLYSSIYNLMDKIGNLKSEIEENLILMSRVPFHSNTNYQRFILEIDYKQIIGEYEDLRNTIMHTFEHIKNPQVHEKMNKLYAKLFDINLSMHKFIRNEG